MALDDSTTTNYYPYEPNHVVPAVFAALVGISLLLHTWQNFHFSYWRVTFFMFYAGLIFTAGWITRTIASYNPTSLPLYIAQTMLILMGPPVYSAAEYNILGRMMHYLPMHAPLHPSRVVYFFVYLGVGVEVLTAIGAARLSGGSNAEKSEDERNALLESGGALISAAAVLQGVIECLFMSMVGLLHRRCRRAKMATSTVTSVCVMLYGTSTLILLRCIFRAVEKFSLLSVLSSPSHACTSGPCATVLRHEWYIFAFEGAPMVLYTFWLNIMHPARYLPQRSVVYLDFEGVERVGPGWTDRRTVWETFVDPFDFVGLVSGKTSYEKFWERGNEWPVADKRKKKTGVDC